MNTVKFTVNGTTKDSYTDFGLILKPRKLNLPEPKINKIELIGTSKTIDLSEALTGEIEFNDRSFELEFNVVDETNTFNTKLTTIANFLHGRQSKIVFTNDSGYYFLGRLKVPQMEYESALGQITIECECEPFKYKTNKTIVTQAVTGSEVITLANARMSVVPKITTTASITFTYNNNSYTVNATTIIPEIQLKEGNNTFIITNGIGNITFEYQEGDL